MTQHDAKPQMSKKKTKSSPDYAQWAQSLIRQPEMPAPSETMECPEPKQEKGPCKPTARPACHFKDSCASVDSLDASDAIPFSSFSGLVIVPTPIGNLGDITLRALHALQSVDRVACEDTRVTGGLLHRYGIKKPLISYHDHNASWRGETILTHLQNGETIALVSDAGTPLISDPGYRLVCAARDKDIPITVLPGANAALTALAGSGLPTDRFLFAGFLPSKTTARRKAIEELSSLKATLVFYEAPQRLLDTLQDCRAIMGDTRPASIARELTKLYEEQTTAPLATLITHIEQSPPKGEIVLIIAPPAETELPPEDIDTLLREALKTQSVRDASAFVAQKTGQKKSEIYARALFLDKATD